MNDEEKYKITSNDFADLLADETIIQEILSKYSNVSTDRINAKYSVAYLPVENMSSNIIYDLGYDTIPKCFGLLSGHNYETLSAVQYSNLPSNDLSGQGVLVGFIDTGIDYRNLAFQYANQTSRIVSIWDQTIESESAPKGFFYGTEYTKEQINFALKDENPLSIVPSIDEVGHGTMLAGVAGGSLNPENSFVGVAPNVEFVVVKLKPAKAYIKEFFFYHRTQYVIKRMTLCSG